MVAVKENNGTVHQSVSLQSIKQLPDLIICQFDAVIDSGKLLSHIRGFPVKRWDFKFIISDAILFRQLAKNVLQVPVVRMRHGA